MCVGKRACCLRWELAVEKHLTKAPLDKGENSYLSEDRLVGGVDDTRSIASFRLVYSLGQETPSSNRMVRWGRFMNGASEETINFINCLATWLYGCHSAGLLIKLIFYIVHILSRYFLGGTEMQMDKKGQEMFLSFILQRVKEDKVEEAKELLAENFKKQDEDTFTKEDIEQFIPKMMNLLKPDKIEEVKAVTKQFSGDFQQK